MYLPPFAKKISHSAHILFKLPHPFQNSFISYLHSFWEYRSDLLVLRRIYIPCKGFRQLCHKTGLFLFMRFCSRRPQPPKQKNGNLESGQFILRHPLNWRTLVLILCYFLMFFFSLGAELVCGYLHRFTALFIQPKCAGQSLL